MQIVDPVPLCKPPNCKKLAFSPSSSEFVQLVGQLVSRDLNVQVDLFVSAEDYSIKPRDYYAGMKMIASDA